ncbi:hypothetical protein DBB36_02200 [Flavobacterium sp. WLB]|uniref:hypothetical protein n=1 Tax=unclassified Flavobacterium TaxID=196869 RepID=UPI0006ABAAC6|nr:MULTISPECIES: hypothetical protein [unclassified Flavobacterium]KOP39213.1 hypothetical protein AKO67_06620 [Flavobacterium sp. VMW]OWU89125.1 hypothetical protein APR43_18135 [Flavobacterium sp. NLM]PUU71692.1 hypothetical protein DBB36_02200 [Flavobacterium sp. WLB]
MSSQSHFFVESGGFTQSREQAFGPQSSTEFNLTSKFSLASPKKAYAICKGVVLVQPQTGSTDKVNLILRPYKQPFPGLNIKYFIYRGLQRSDFFTAGSNPKIIQKTDQTSDFINNINDDFGAFNDNRKDSQGNPIQKPDFTAKYIGYKDNPTEENEATELAIPLSSFFFKESEFVEADNTFDETDDFELPMIDIGKSLGKFAQGEGGIDVVLNYGDYKQNFDNGEFDFNLKYARKAFDSISITEGTPYQQKLLREQSVQFVDIAAFYGLFVPQNSVDVVTAGTKTTKKGVEIFNSVVNNFFTKNNWYIYIQSDRTRSYDFYGNYKIDDGPENLKTGLLANSEGIVPMTAVTYSTEGWPVLIDKQEQANTVTTNNLYLQFTTDNNNNTAFYGQIAKVANAQKDNFINADGLLLPPDEERNYSDLTAEIQLTTPAYQGKNIAALSVLLYQGKINTYKADEVLDENGDLVVVIGQANFFDDVFSLIKAEPLLKLNGDESYSRMTSEKPNLINKFYDKKQQGISIVQTLTVNDVIETGIEEPSTVSRVTYLTEAGDVMNNAVSAIGSTTPDTKTTASASGAVTKNKTYQLPDPYYYNLKLFTDSTQTITGLELKTMDGSNPNKIILGLTKDENNAIKALITDDTKNPRLFLIDLFENENELISPENIAYQKYKVLMVAENVNGETELFESENDVFVYSLDRKYHFSKKYSEYMPNISIGIEGDNLINEQITI